MSIGVAFFHSFHYPQETAMKPKPSETFMKSINRKSKRIALNPKASVNPKKYLRILATEDANSTNTHHKTLTNRTMKT